MLRVSWVGPKKNDKTSACRAADTRLKAQDLKEPSMGGTVLAAFLEIRVCFWPHAIFANSTPEGTNAGWHPLFATSCLEQILQGNSPDCLLSRTQLTVTRNKWRPQQQQTIVWCGVKMPHPFIIRPLVKRDWRTADKGDRLKPQRSRSARGAYSFFAGMHPGIKEAAGEAPLRRTHSRGGPINSTIAVVTEIPGSSATGVPL